MAKIKVRIKIDHVVEFESENYRDDWIEYCEQEGEDEMGDIQANFAITCFSTDVDEGDVDLAMLLEAAAVQIEPVA